MAKKRHYYTIYRPCGPNTLNMDGAQANRLERYATRKARDAAVDCEPNREAVNATHRIVRLARRRSWRWMEDNYSFWGW